MRREIVKERLTRSPPVKSRFQAYLGVAVTRERSSCVEEPVLPCILSIRRIDKFGPI